MNGVLFYNWFGNLNGALIDVFEYFIAIFEYNKNVYLYILNSDKKLINKLIKVFENRYDLNDLDYKKNIIPCKNVLGIEFDNVLVLDYSTIFKTRGLIKSKNIIVIQDKHTNNQDYQYNKKLCNVIYYGEMPFTYNDYEYRMKFLLNRFKPLKKVKSAIYLNSPKNNDYSFLNKIKLPDKPIIYKKDTHENNLFEQFDTYVYYHANKWFDPHPRLFIECFYYNKQLIYFNNYKIIDGSYYRWHDIQKRGIKDRQLNLNDEIIQYFI